MMYTECPTWICKCFKALEVIQRTAARRGPMQDEAAGVVGPGREVAMGWNGSVSRAARVIVWAPVLLMVVGLVPVLDPTGVEAATYYVSSSAGDDDNDGLSPGSAFQTITKVNSLSLSPGDQVRFACQDTWRADPLVVTRSGDDAADIVYEAYPAGCTDKPVLSGARPISGWTAHATNIWRADLDDGANAGLFPLGVNQLFRSTGRLPFGRWPDVQGHSDGGWASVDAQPTGLQIVDAELPAASWTGAVVHLRGMRWYVMNREVVASSGSTLTLGDTAQCWGGSCTGWGYFISNHLATLSREGEWFWDEASNRVYLYSTQGAPADGEVEGSVVLTGAGDYLGGVILGRHLYEHVSHVRIEGLRIERWFASGITTPTNYEADECSYITIRDVEVRDVDDAGIRLTVWVWNAAANGNGPDGWRGGHHMLIDDTVIERANHFGIDCYSRDSTFEDLVITDIARIPYLGRSGMGCGYTGTNCTEHGAGIRLNRGGSTPDHSGLRNILRRNRIERVGMNGIDVFGRLNTLRSNVIREACSSKADCGAIRTFGNDSLATSLVSDVRIIGNIILDTIGNTEGAHADYRGPLGFGLYIDHYSRNVDAIANTVSGCSLVGILYQSSTGEVRDNVVYGNHAPGWWASELSVGGTGAQVDSTGNVLFSLADTQWVISADGPGSFSASDGNALFGPYRSNPISVGGVPRSLAQWQAYSGLDLSSHDAWYSLAPGDPPRSTIHVNEGATGQTVILDGPWLDLDAEPVASLVLDPYSSAVVVRREAVIFIDGFESGDLGSWTSSTLQRSDHIQ